MHIEKTYSLQDIADILKRPRTTLNNWYQSFRIYIPVVGSGRTKRFKEEAIDIFRLIMDLKDRNEPNEIIEQYLTNSVTEITIDNDQNEQNPNVITSIVQGYENILAEVSEQRDILIKMYQESQTKNEELVNLIQTMSKEHAVALEKIHSSLENDRKEQNDSIGKLHEILEKEKTDREAEQKRVEERDKELLENMRRLKEEKESKKEEKPWFKKFFGN